MNGFNDVVIHQVGLTQSVHQNAISRQGEGFRLAGVDQQTLCDSVYKELGSKGDRMRRAMYGVWKGSTEVEVDCSRVGITDESQREKELRIAAELGIQVMPQMNSEALWAAIYKANAKRDREALVQRYGTEKVAHRDFWELQSEMDMWLLVVFYKGKKRFAWVVRINGAEIAERGRRSIVGEVPKFDCNLVSMGRYVEISVDSIVWMELVKEADVDDACRLRALRAHVDRVAATL